MSAPIALDDAIATVLAHTRVLAPERVSLSAALDRVLAEDVVAAGDVPSFANSAMDGFAVHATAQAGDELRVVGESRAGAPAERPVGPGEASRISTGAPLPPGATAVVQVERTTPGGEHRIRIDETPPGGQHVRHPGEDLRAGATVLEAGTALGPAELGAAVNAGRGDVLVTRVPRVAIVTTGDELVEPGASLGPGQIHGSNALTLAALTARAGGRVTHSTSAGDTAPATVAALDAALAGADVLLISGGVSVGPHDHVKPALGTLGATEGFWRVALRPGGPLWFGTHPAGPTLVFGLPGNPVSAMVTFLLLARPALRALQGLEPTRGRTTARLTAEAPRTPGRTHAVRVTLSADGTLATPTGPQGSHLLTSMLGAEALALVGSGEHPAPAGERVEIVAI